MAEFRPGSAKLRQTSTSFALDLSKLPADPTKFGRHSGNFGLPSISLRPDSAGVRRTHIQISRCCPKMVDFGKAGCASRPGQSKAGLPTTLGFGGPTARSDTNHGHIVPGASFEQFCWHYFGTRGNSGWRQRRREQSRSGGVMHSFTHRIINPGQEWTNFGAWQHLVEPGSDLA